MPLAAGRLRFMFWALYLGSCSSKPGKRLAVRSEVIPWPARLLGGNRAEREIV